MKKMQTSMTINAPAKRVWEIMLGNETYREWTKAFNGDSYFEGNWEKGSKMLFLGTDPETGEKAGMVSRIAENRPYEFLSIEHIGMIQNGVEDTTSEAAKEWKNVYENYTFKEQDGVTEVLVEMDVEEEYIEMFEEMWPEALKRLKTIVEQQ